MVRASWPDATPLQVLSLSAIFCSVSTGPCMSMTSMTKLSSSMICWELIISVRFSRSIRAIFASRPRLDSSYTSVSVPAITVLGSCWLSWLRRDEMSSATA